jgi:hypothetical protein
MGKVWSQDELEAAINLYNTGLSMREIGAELGRPKNGVVGVINRHRHQVHRVAQTDKRPMPPMVLGRRIRFKKHKPAIKAHPLVRRLIEIMNLEQCSIEQLCTAVGMSRVTFNGWKTVSMPSLELLIACLNYLGYDLGVISKKEDRIE